MTISSSTTAVHAEELARSHGVADRSVGLPFLDRLAVLYLALPVFIFLVGWIKWWIGLAAAGLLALALRGAWPSRASASAFRAPLPVLLAVLVAVAWTSLGGAGHLFFANFDWYTRDAVLRDLVIGGWPVGYGQAGELAQVLRAPIGYYLPAALVGKVLGVGLADAALLVWTTLGVALFLAMAVSQKSSILASALVIAVLVLFSGMDLLGTILRGGFMLATKLTPIDHLEWWAERYQYSSHTTQLFWVPNHALPGWLATMLLIRNGNRTQFLKILPVVVAAIPLWSPLTALGFLPLAAVQFVREAWTRRSLATFDPASLIAAAVVISLTGAYLTMGSSEIASGATRGHGEPWWFYLPHYLQFVLLEGGILCFLLLFVRRDILLWTAGLTLLVLPAIWFGPSNDLVMRGSIPALVVLAVAAARALVEPSVARERRVYWPIVAVLVLGVPTAATEIARAVVEPAWKPDLSRNLIEASGGSSPTHYVAKINGSIVSGMLRPVRQIAPRAQSVSPQSQVTRDAR